ncbi:MAG: MFS transporter [Halodesulfurarchaeum sp.]
MNRNDRAIVGLAMVAHGMVHTYELSIPILMTIWLDTFQVSPGRLGLVVSIGYALFGLGAIPGGVLADLYGSRRLIALALFGMGSSFVVLSMAPSIPAIALGLVVWGASASVYHPSGLSMISKGVTQRGDAFAYHGMAGNLGIALGPLATTLLLLFAGWNLVAGLLAIPALAASVFATRLRFDESAAVADEEGDTRTDSVSSLSEFVSESRTLLLSPFLAVVLIMMLSGLYYRGFLTFLPELLSTFQMFQPVEVGGRLLQPSRYVYAALLVVGMGGQYVGGKLTDRIPTERGLTIAYGILAILAVLFLPASELGYLPFLLVGGILGFFLFVVQPLYQATVAEYTPSGTRGLSYGYTYLGVFGIGAAGAAIAGGIIQFFDAAVLFFVLAGFAVTAAGLAIYLMLR